MNIKETINKTALLAKLQFEGDELEKFAKTFEQILEYISIIDGLDLENVAPLAQIIDYDYKFRKDIPAQGLDLQEALLNAPSKNENFFKVPKVIDRNEHEQY